MQPFVRFQTLLLRVFSLWSVPGIGGRLSTNTLVITSDLPSKRSKAEPCDQSFEDFYRRVQLRQLQEFIGLVCLIDVAGAHNQGFHTQFSATTVLPWQRLPLPQYGLSVSHRRGPVRLRPGFQMAAHHRTTAQMSATTHGFWRPAAGCRVSPGAVPSCPCRARGADQNATRSGRNAIRIITAVDATQVHGG